MPRKPDNMTEANFCRKMGWGAGQRLVGDEGHGPEVIEITAIGDEKILAKTISPRAREESLWGLGFRDWQPVAADAETEPQVSLPVLHIEHALRRADALVKAVASIDEGAVQVAIEAYRAARVAATGEMIEGQMFSPMRVNWEKLAIHHGWIPRLNGDMHHRKLERDWPAGDFEGAARDIDLCEYDAIEADAVHDRIITDGLPEGWFIQDRLAENIALLCRKDDFSIFGFSSVCLRPKAMTTDNWLLCATIIAEGFDHANETRRNACQGLKEDA